MREDDNYVFPTSFPQRRMWLLDQLAPGDPSYSLLSSLRFHARINDDALERSLDEIVRRHESLRTTFTMLDGEPVQVVRPELAMPIERVDLRRLPSDESVREVGRIAAAVASRPFDLEKGPLLRVVLVGLSDDDHTLLLSIHHIAADGWSLGLFFRELAELYPALNAGRPSPLAPLPIQYSDYAVWQREILRGEALESHLTYWRSQLADLPNIALPTERLSSSTRSPLNSHRSFTLAAPLVDALQTLGQREGCTLFMTLLAGFFALIHRHTGQEDFAVGTPIAGRTRAELEGLIGVFVNTLALRADLHAQPTFSELLRRVHQVTLDAYTHQECPFELVVEALRPQRHLDRNPLVQVVFHLQNAPRPVCEGSASDIDLPTSGAAFDLAIDLWRGERGLAGRCEYNPGLLDAATIDQLLARFQTLLADAAMRPERPVSALALLPADERALLDAWGRPSETPPTVESVYTLFARQASRTPDAVALVAAGTQLSFRALARHAQRLASRLRHEAVERGEPIGLYLPRTLSQGVALLGVHMARAAFISLDLAHPPSHIAELLHAARPRFILVEETGCRLSAALTILEAEQRPTLIEVMDQGETIEELAADAPPAPTDLAYIVFTSGTSGKPKGIEVEHRTLARRMTAVQAHYRLESSDRVLHFASFCFDASIEELLAPWLVGATVVMRPEESFATFDDLRDFIVRNRLTVLNLPTAYWHAWVAELARTGGKVPASVSLVIVGSEPALPERLKVWQELAPGVRWINAYGPAEATITATLDEPSALQSVDEPVAIGRPIAGTEVRVLDKLGAPVPVGVAGELYLGGDGLARGYLEAPDLTAMAFMPAPSGRGRLYRTGDRVRWRADGRLVFLGRVDEQVKIRGIRIEPAEVEAALCQHPAVDAAVLLSQTIGDGELRLVAYLAMADDTSVEEVRRYLGRRLPTAMVPSVFVPLAALPLTANGKVDRCALPPPTTVAPHLVAPRNSTEAELARVWSGLLAIPVADVDVDDDFFRLGGHSLLATQLLSRIRESFGVEFSLRQFFEHPTIADLAAIIDSAPRAESPASSLGCRSRTRATDLLEKLDQLPEDEVDALLTEFLDP